MAQNADLKRYRILEAARIRFSHFGLAKTTMSEIASDLSFSKALLYYYYPDKHSLYSAVLEFVFTQLNERIGEIIEQETDIEEAFMKVIECRIMSIQEHYSLFEMGHGFRRDVPNEMFAILQSSYEKEMNMISSLLRKGVSKGELLIDDTDECAKLLLLSLYGMRIGLLKDLDWISLPTPEKFQQIFSMQKKVAKIFLRGISEA